MSAALVKSEKVINIEGRIVPIEVKAGATGRLLTLKQFMQEKNIPLGVRISQLPLTLEGGILSIPFCLIHALPRLIREAISGH